MEIFQTLIAAVFSNALILSVLGWLGKSLFEKIIQRDSDRLEIEIKAKADAMLEEIKNELQLRAIEHQIKLSRLHETRASVIAELNALLAEVMWEAESFLSPMSWLGEPDKKEKHKKSSEKLTEFFRYFDKNKIYLPETLCATIENLVMEVREYVIRYGVYVGLDDDNMMDHTREQMTKAGLFGWDAIKTKIPAVRAELEKEFRTLLAP